MFKRQFKTSLGVSGFLQEGFSEVTLDQRDSLLEVQVSSKVILGFQRGV